MRLLAFAFAALLLSACALRPGPPQLAVESALDTTAFQAGAHAGS